MGAMELETLAVDGQQRHPEAFPLVYGLNAPGATLSDVTSWLRGESERLVDTLSLHGAILLRGLPVEDANDFDAFIRAFGLKSFTYERLFFFCEKAPEAAGETPVCRSDVLLSQLERRDPAFVEACLRLGVRYSNVMPAEDDGQSGQGRSWCSTLGARSEQQAEARLDSLGYRHEWLGDGSLRATTPPLPAVRTLADGRRVFFNQLIAAFRGWKDARNDPRKSIAFADGSAIPTTGMQTAIELADELSYDIAWQTGDVALIDNFLVMHGRRPFVGERRVLASLVANDGSRLVA
jgi:hypothetical protein